MFVDFKGDFDRLNNQEKLIRVLEDEFGDGRYYDDVAKDILDVLGIPVAEEA